LFVNRIKNFFSIFYHFKFFSFFQYLSFSVNFLIIFEYNKKVKEEVIIRAALKLSSEKMREQIQPDLAIKESTNPDLGDIKVKDIKLQDHLDVTIYFKFKGGTETGNNVGLD